MAKKKRNIKKKERNKTEVVKSHYRPIKGKFVRIKSYKRPPKPKLRRGIRRAETRKFEVTYFRDSQGRLVSKRKYRKLK